MPELRHEHRTRWSSPTRSSRRARPQFGDWLRDHVLLTGLLTALVLALLSEMPWLSRGVRVLLLQFDVVAFGTLIAIVGLEQEDLKSALRRGATPWLLALLVWCVVTAALSPYRAFAVAELLRLILCAEVFAAAAYGLRAEDLRPLLGGVLGLGCAVALYGFLRFGSAEQGNEVVGIFGNHEQAGSFLVLMVPVALALALDRREPPKTLMAAQAAAVVLAGALLLTRTRSAWAGGAFSLITLSLLALRFASVRLDKRNKYLVVGPLLIVGLAFAGFAFADQVAPRISQRAGTLVRVLDDTSFRDRLHRWQSACRMAAARPVTGWGLGSFPVLQQNWTHQGDSPARVLAHGTGHQNLAHNFWAQWAAETGLVGLFLYVGTVAAFLLSGLRALGTLPPRWRRTVLMGCVAATVGGCVDAFGAPSYTFPGVSTLFWLWIGVGVAAGREEDQFSLPPTPPAAIGAAVAGLLAAGVVWVVGHHP